MVAASPIGGLISGRTSEPKLSRSEFRALLRGIAASLDYEQFETLAREAGAESPASASARRRVSARQSPIRSKDS